jgi:RluA family pseudouridine synthase
MTLSVLDKGKHHVVVNKPSNMVVVDGRGAPKPTLLDLAQAQWGKGIKPVHRLDRVTTGCCILATDTYGQQALSNAFRKHLVDKRYLAIIEGVPKFESINIDARLERIDDPDAKKGWLAHQTIGEEGKRALTRVRVWAKGTDVCLVEARPETGRMHQIRAHLTHIGFPIVGDKQYGAKLPFGDHAIALFAFAVSFPAPEGGRRFVSAPLPKSFEEFLKAQGIDIGAKMEAELAKFSKVAPKAAPKKRT